MSGKLTSVRRVYGKPLSRLAKKGIEFDEKTLERVGEIILQHIQKEARKDYARVKKTPRGVPMGLPNTDRFFESFTVKISGKSTIVVRSSWPWIERHIEGRKPFKMDWLTRENGVTRVPIVEEDGGIAIVMAPLTKGEAWTHPGAKKFNFLRRGIEKGRKAAVKLLLEEAKKQIAQANLLR